MREAKKHHYVPQWYLRRFVDGSGFLHAHDIAANTFRRQKPKEVMAINHYNRQPWVPEGINPNVLENELGSWLEPQAQLVIDKLLARTSNITDDESAALLSYIAFQRIRVPRQAKMAAELYRSFILTYVHPETAAPILRGEVQLTIKDSFRFDYWRMMSGKLVPYLGRMDWEIVEAAPNAAFITSDSPVSFLNPAFFPFAEPGIALAGTIVVLPLSTKQLLILHHLEHRQEGSAMKVVPEWTSEHRVVAVIFGTVWGEEKVNRHNVRMLALANRMIVSSSKEALEKCVDLAGREGTEGATASPV